MKPLKCLILCLLILYNRPKSVDSLDEDLVEQCGGFKINSANPSTNISFGTFEQDDLKQWTQVAKTYAKSEIDLESVQVTPGHVLQLCADEVNVGCIQFIADNQSVPHTGVSINKISVEKTNYAACFEWDHPETEDSCDAIQLLDNECIRVFHEENCGQKSQPPLSIVTKYDSWLNSEDFVLENGSFVFNPNCSIDGKLGEGEGLNSITNWSLSEFTSDNGQNWCSFGKDGFPSNSQEFYACQNFFNYTKFFINIGLGPLRGPIKCHCGLEPSDPVDATTDNNRFVIIGLPVIVTAISLTVIIVALIFRRFKEPRTQFQINIPKNLNSIPRRKFSIDYNAILGEGEFGEVYKGIIKRTNVVVAIKTVKKPYTLQNVTALINEIKVMGFVGNHPNVICLIGASTSKAQEGKVFGILEMCHKGNLKHYLQKMNEELGQLNSCKFILTNVETTVNYASSYNALDVVTTPEKINLKEEEIRCLLFKWSKEIAAGMDFLGTKNVIHIDVAARNILLTEELNSKIGDFGLSRKLYDISEYKKTANDCLPWKWLSIESLTEKTFSVKSDLWSYGITLWEIFSLGITEPYPDLGTINQLITFLVGGGRLSIPKYADRETFRTIKKCWATDPLDRLDFADLEKYFEEKCTEHSSTIKQTCL